MNIPARSTTILANPPSEKPSGLEQQLIPRYRQHGLRTSWNWLKETVIGALRMLFTGNVPDFFHRNAFERTHPSEPRSGRELLAPPSAWQVVRWIFESVTKFGLASLGVFLISVAPVTKEAIGPDEDRQRAEGWKVITEVSVGIALLVLGVLFLAFPAVWKTRRRLQIQGLALDEEQPGHSVSNVEEVKWQRRRKNMEKADKNDLDVTQSLFGVFVNAAFAILINRPTLEIWGSLVGGVSVSVVAAVVTRFSLAGSIEKASIPLRLLDSDLTDSKLSREAIKEVSSQHRMYIAVAFGLFTGVAAILASLVRRAIDNKDIQGFLEPLVTNAGPSAFNSIALAGSLIIFATSLHEQASHVAIVEADDTKVFLETHGQSAKGDQPWELHLLAEIVGCEIHVYNEAHGVVPKEYKPWPPQQQPQQQLQPAVVKLYRTADGYRTIEKNFLPTEGGLATFYGDLREKFWPIECRSKILCDEVKLLTEVKPILKSIRKLNKRAFARSSYECIAHETPTLFREALLPTRRKMTARLRGDAADLRRRLRSSLQYLKPPVDMQTNDAKSRYVDEVIARPGRWVDLPALLIASRQLNRCIKLWEHKPSNDPPLWRWYRTVGDAHLDQINLALNDEVFEPLIGAALLEETEVSINTFSKGEVSLLAQNDCLLHSLLTATSNAYKVAPWADAKKYAAELNESLRARGILMMHDDQEMGGPFGDYLRNAYDRELQALDQRIERGDWDHIHVPWSLRSS